MSNQAPSPKPATVELYSPTVLALWGSYVGSKGIGGGPQRRTRRWGATFVLVSTLPLWFRANSLAFRRSCCGFARIPLRFDAPAVVSREFRCVSTLPLWFRANSVAFRRSRCGFARIPLRFDAPAVVSREFRCVSTLPLWFRANSVAFRRSRCGFARIPAFLRFRRSRCGFARIPLRFDAPAVVSREFRCVSTLPLWFRANFVASSMLPLLGGPLRLRAATAHAVGRAFVSTLPLWFRANSPECPINNLYETLKATNPTNFKTAKEFKGFLPSSKVAGSRQEFQNHEKIVF